MLAGPPKLPLYQVARLFALVCFHVVSFPGRGQGGIQIHWLMKSTFLSVNENCFSIIFFVLIMIQILIGVLSVEDSS